MANMALKGMIQAGEITNKFTEIQAKGNKATWSINVKEGWKTVWAR